MKKFIIGQKLYVNAGTYYIPSTVMCEGHDKNLIHLILPFGTESDWDRRAVLREEEFKKMPIKPIFAPKGE